MSNKSSIKVPTFEEIREALKLPLEITVRHDAMGRVIRKKKEELADGK